MNNMRDVVIIGGGASGVICAIRAAERSKNRKITILEKQDRILRKLMSTGNGRCNFTNINASSADYNGSFKKYVDVILEKYSPEYVIEYFKKLGLISRVEESGRVYPYSNHASAVVDMLRYRLETFGIEVVCNAKVNKVIKENKSFRIISNNGEYKAEKVVFTVGSPAGTKLGGNYSGLEMLKELGHNVSKPYPALCPILVDSKILPSVKGVRSQGKAALFNGNKLISEDFGEIQFTEKALSGICVFNLASYVKNNKNLTVRISLLPDYNNEELRLIINRQIMLYNNRTCEDLFTGIFQRKLGLALLKECNIKASFNISKLNDNQINKIVNIINNWNFNVVGVSDFNSAQVAVGGVIGKEIDPGTMESKIINGLYICGEAIDINGDCGGYNLQFAFSSGMVAGDSV